jgi:hypothetical protein
MTYGRETRDTKKAVRERVKNYVVKFHQYQREIHAIMKKKYRRELQLAGTMPVYTVFIPISIYCMICTT